MVLLVSVLAGGLSAISLKITRMRPAGRKIADISMTPVAAVRVPPHRRRSKV